MTQQVNMAGGFPAAIFALARDLFQYLSRAVGAAIVDEKDLIVELADLIQHLFHIPAFVEDGNRDEQSQTPLLLVISKTGDGRTGLQGRQPVNRCIKGVFELILADCETACLWRTMYPEIFRA